MRILDVVQRAGAVALGCVLLGSCGPTVAARAERPEPQASATPSPTDGFGLTPADVAAVYGAVLRSYGGWRGTRLWVEDSPATATDDRLWASPRAAPFDEPTRRAIAERVGPGMRWIGDADEVPRSANGRGVLGKIALVGPIHGSGDRVTVAINTYCGGRCGRIYTHAVVRSGTTWKLAGSGYECAGAKCPGGVVY